MKVHFNFEAVGPEVRESIRQHVQDLEAQGIAILSHQVVAVDTPSFTAESLPPDKRRYDVGLVVHVPADKVADLAAFMVEIGGPQ